VVAALVFRDHPLPTDATATVQTAPTELRTAVRCWRLILGRGCMQLRYCCSGNPAGQARWQRWTFCSCGCSCRCRRGCKHTMAASEASLEQGQSLGG
jgi:hypothetical protein